MAAFSIHAGQVSFMCSGSTLYRSATGRIDTPKSSSLRPCRARRLFRLADTSVDIANEFLGMVFKKNFGRKDILEEQRGHFRKQGVGKWGKAQALRFLELGKALREVGHAYRGSYGQVVLACP